MKEIQDTLDGKENLDQCDFNWTPPSAPEDTLSGIQTHIRHLRRKQTAMCKWLESVSEVGPEEDKSKAELKSMEKDDESKTEKFDEDRRGGAEPEDTEALGKRKCLWMLQSLAEDEPSEDILEKMNTTKEEWSMTSRLFRDDDPQDDVLKWFGMPSKEDVFKLKRELECMNTFGCDFEEKMRRYWNAFKDGCKGRDVSEIRRVMEENFVMNGISTSSAT